MKQFFDFLVMKVEILFDKSFSVGDTKEENECIHAIKKKIIARNEARTKRAVNVIEYFFIKDMAVLDFMFGFDDVDVKK